MDTDLLTQKAIIIEQFKQIDDIDLLNAIKSLLDYSQKKEADIHYVPEAHQELVIKRFNMVKDNPDRLLDWDNAKKKL